MATDPPATIANPDLARLHSARGLAVGVRDLAKTRLDDVKSAMLSHAWSGTSQSDAFYSELTTQIAKLGTSGERCVENVDAAIRRCPSTVANPAAAAH